MAVATIAGTAGKHSSTSARVDFAVDNNGSWNDAIQFGDDGDLTWDLIDQDFECDIQRNAYDTTPLVSLSTTNGRIIVDDAIQRVIHFDLNASDIQSNLTPGVYVYDFVMVDMLDITKRVPLMHGTITITQGVTYP